MNYTIGKFSELLGVTGDTLRLYEKRDIIKPVKDAKNNYRYFNDLDARPLLMSRFLRSLEISVEDVSALINNASLEDITEKIEESQEDLQTKIDRCTRLFNKISEIRDEISRVDLAMDQFQIIQLPGIYRLQQTNKNDLIENHCLKETVSIWMKTLPFCFFCLRIDSNQFFSKENYDYNWGLAIFENEIQHFNLKINEKIQYISPQTYLTITCKSPHKEEYLLKSHKKRIFDYLQEKNYSVTGDILGKLIFTQRFNQEFFSYIKVTIPIGSENK